MNEVSNKEREVPKYLATPDPSSFNPFTGECDREIRVPLVRMRTHGGRVAHLVPRDVAEGRALNGQVKALCGFLTWRSAETPETTPTCKACERTATDA